MSSYTEYTATVALLSELVYELDEDRTQNSKNLANQGLQKMRKDPHKSYHLQNIEIVETSRDYMYCVDHVQKRQYFISRGTNFKNIRDIYNDVRIIFFSEAKSREKTFSKFIERKIDSNPGYVNITGGHSLGGTVASLAYMKNKKLNVCETFNPGNFFINIRRYIQLIQNTFTKLLKIKDRSQEIISHHIQYDFISLIPLLNSRQCIYPSGDQLKHSISNFTGQHLPRAPESYQKNQLQSKLNGVDCILREFNLSKITGIIIKDKSCDFLLQNTNIETGIYITDLAVALSVYYDDTIPQNMKKICFSLDPTNIYDLKQQQKKVFYPDEYLNRRVIGGTEFGDILYQADFLMKQISLGLNEKRQLLNKDQYLANLGLTPSINQDFSRQSELSRLWLQIKDINLNEYKQNEISIQKILNILDVTVEVQARELDSSTFTDKIIQNLSKQSYEFAKKFSDQYSKIEKIYYIFKRLRQLFKAVVLAQWMYINNIPIDFDTVQQIVNNNRIKRYNFFSPSLYYSVQNQIGQEGYIISVVGGVDVSVDIQKFIKKSPIQIFNGIQTIQNPLFKRSYCKECNEELSIEEISMCQNERLLCKEHSGHQCQICNEVIFKTEFFYQLRENFMIHPSCFKCDLCEELICKSFQTVFGVFYAHSQCEQPLGQKIEEFRAQCQEEEREYLQKQQKIQSLYDRNNIVNPVILRDNNDENNKFKNKNNENNNKNINNQKGQRILNEEIILQKSTCTKCKCINQKLKQKDLSKISEWICNKCQNLNTI